MICFPLDNTPYEAKDMGTYLATRTRGVFSSDGNLAVTPGESGLSVSVSPGLAWLKWSDYWGTAALQEQALTLDLDTADGALKRIDAIVCRLDKVNNRAEIVVKKGAPSSAPIVVPPVRDANYDELYIATVLIGAGVISISASAITDQRLNEEYCGLMRDGVTGIPTASLHAQAQQILTELTDALNAQIVRQSAEFDAWFDDLKGKLGEDPATALQQQVDNLNAAVVGDAFQASGTPVSIAYAGAQRIASITAYGETPQGGTTEAPVALTGVDSAILFEQHTPINLAKPITADRYGVSVITNADGSVTVKGTATDETWPRLVEVNIPSAIIAGDITISLSSPASVKMQFQVMTPDGRKESYGLSAGSTSITVKIKSGYTGMHIFLSLLPDQTIDETFHIMIAQGTEPVPFVPYVEPSITHLPIPRPLHKVGDVRDVCRTRVKSVYDKRIVLDGSENWRMADANGLKLFLFNQGLPNGIFLANAATLCSNRYKAVSYNNRSDLSVYAYDYDGTSLGVADASFDTVDNWKTYLSANPLTVYYQSTAYNGTNGLDICLTEYQNGFVELDGTEGIEYQSAYNRFAYTLPSTAVNDSGFCSHYKKLMTSAPGEDKYIVIRPEAVYFYDSQYTNADAFNAYLAAQKSAGTPVQVAYQLATPEVYATDPVDFDNTAGPLTVMTGGEVEVRMTELVGNREFTERLSYIGNPNLLDNSNFTNPVNQRDGTSYSASTGNTVYAIDRWRIEGATYTVATHTLSGTSYTNRACRMAQFIEMEQYGLAIGDTLTFSLETNGTKHSATAKILDRDQYSNFESVPSAYSCADFDVVLCTGLSKPSILSFTICPKKALVLEWAKLEKGSVATPYVHKSYGAELSACQRYFYYLDATKWYACYQITGWGLIIPIDLPVPMRAQPTANTVGEVKVFTPSGWVNATSMSTNQFNRDKARINIVLTMPSGSMDSYEGRAMVATGIESLSADL